MKPLRILTFSQLIDTVWPGVDLAEEFGQGTLKMVHFYTRVGTPRCGLLQITTPSTAASIQAEHNRERLEDMDDLLFFVTSVRSLTIRLLEEAVRAARPFQVVIDSDTLAADLREECASNIGQTVWMDEEEPPQDWEEQVFSELRR